MSNIYQILSNWRRTKGHSVINACPGGLCLTTCDGLAFRDLRVGSVLPAHADPQSQATETGCGDLGVVTGVCYTVSFQVLYSLTYVDD